MIVLTAIVLWLVCGFLAARGIYADFIEYASLHGAEWNTMAFVFVMGPVGLFAALINGKSRYVFFIENTSPNPIKKSYVGDDWTDVVSEADFNKNLGSWEVARKFLLFKPWDHVEIERDPLDEYFRNVIDSEVLRKEL